MAENFGFNDHAHRGCAAVVFNPQDHNERGKNLAESALHVAEEMNTVHHSGQALREALAITGIVIPPSDAKDVSSIPGMEKLPSNSFLLPGDAVVWGASSGAPHGGSFVVTPDYKAASDHVGPIPNLANLPELKIFRSES